MPGPGSEPGENRQSGWEDSKHGCLHELLGAVDRRASRLRLLPGSPASGGSVCMEDRTQLPRFWPVIQNLVVQELRVRYQRSILGFFWTLLESAPDDGDPLVGLLGDVQEGRPLRGLPVRGDGPLGIPERQRQRVRGLHHRQRGVDPEDLRSQAGLPALPGPDQPGDAGPLAGLPVRAARAAGGEAVGADDPAAAGPGCCLRSSRSG